MLYFIDLLIISSSCNRFPLSTVVPVFPRDLLRLWRFYLPLPVFIRREVHVHLISAMLSCLILTLNRAQPSDFFSKLICLLLLVLQEYIHSWIPVSTTKQIYTFVRDYEFSGYELLLLSCLRSLNY